MHAMNASRLHKSSARKREAETNSATAAAHSAAGISRQLLARLADVFDGGFLHVWPSPGLVTATASSGCARELGLRAAFSREVAGRFNSGDCRRKRRRCKLSA